MDMKVYKWIDKCIWIWINVLYYVCPYGYWFVRCFTCNTFDPSPSTNMNYLLIVQHIKVTWEFHVNLLQEYICIIYYIHSERHSE
jgi:hypothetical protein